jgi:hypothetical protein
MTGYLLCGACCLLHKAIPYVNIKYMSQGFVDRYKSQNIFKEGHEMNWNHSNGT